MKIFTADFETNNSQQALKNNSSHVWLWDICDCDDYSHITGVDIDSFFQELRKLKKSCTMYFHNLKFDGNFILNYLETKGFTHQVDGSMKVKDYKTLITDTGVYYEIKICVKKRVTITMRDSSKKLVGSVASIAKAYGLPILKGEIDYLLDRPLPYTPTEEEISYIHNDTEIIARVMNVLYEKEMDKMTSASDTMAKYKSIVGNDVFKMLFPILPLEDDNFFREAYRGGVVIADSRRSERVLEEDVYAYDINSSYPSVMNESELPYGVPIKYNGAYIDDKNYPLYIQKIKINMELKKDHVPTVICKTAFRSKLEYITSTENEEIELTLTSVDLKLMFKHYNVFSIVYLEGYKFQQSKNLFKRFIGPIYEAKQTTKGAEKQLNKIWLNSLYGKFATNPVHVNKLPQMESGLLKFTIGTPEVGNPVYTAVAAFITSYGRLKLLSAIQANYENFVYCDTDSVHLLKPAVGIEIDENKLGAWALEKTYSKSKYLGQKTYMGLKENGQLDVKVAGCPDRVKEKITFENFEYGETFPGKLMPKSVKGGVVLVESTFSLNRRD